MHTSVERHFVHDITHDLTPQLCDGRQYSNQRTAVAVEAGLWDVMLVATFHLKIHNAPILRVKQALLHWLLGLEDDGTTML